MGMWEKDRAFGGTRLDKWIDDDVSFIVWDASIVAEDIPTEIGVARKAELVVSSFTEPNLVEKVGTLASAICEKVGLAEPSDFPAVVMTQHVEGKKYGKPAYVLSFVRPYDHDGSPVAWKDSGEVYISGKASEKVKS